MHHSGEGQGYTVDLSVGAFLGNKKVGYFCCYFFFITYPGRNQHWAEKVDQRLPGIFTNT